MSWGLPLPIFLLILNTFLQEKKMNTGYIFIKHSGGGIISITKDAVCTHLLSKGILLLGIWHLCFFTNHKIKTLFVMFLYSMPNQYRVTELEGKRKNI